MLPTLIAAYACSGFSTLAGATSFHQFTQSTPQNGSFDTGHRLKKLDYDCGDSGECDSGTVGYRIKSPIENALVLYTSEGVYGLNTGYAYPVSPDKDIDYGKTPRIT